MRLGRGFFLVSSRVAGDAPAELLIGAVSAGNAAAAKALVLCLIPHHRVFDEFADLRERAGLVMMAVDVGDEEILVSPLDRLLVGVV